MSGSQVEELGKMITAQMKSVYQRNSGITIELGTITSNMGLSVDSLGNTIPKGDYMISRHLMQEMSVTTNSVALNTGETDGHKHAISGHSHTATLPNKLRGIQAGDRVLIAWAGTEPIVVDIVISS